MQWNLRLWVWVYTPFSSKTKDTVTRKKSFASLRGCVTCVAPQTGWRHELPHHDSLKFLCFPVASQTGWRYELSSHDSFVHYHDLVHHRMHKLSQVTNSTIPKTDKLLINQLLEISWMNCAKIWARKEKQIIRKHSLAKRIYNKFQELWKWSMKLQKTYFISLEWKDMKRLWNERTMCLKYKK